MSELTRTHLRFGWGALTLFMLGGLALEALHGFKVGFYLDVDVETRRTMWRLAHAHGALLALVNLAFAWAVGQLSDWPRAGSASKLLRAGTVLLPAGFFLGGAWIHGGDPGLGVLLAPVGGLLVVIAAAQTARAIPRKDASSGG